ncbi:MAG: cbb3-type cytochrome oxidase assembly protein CcoS [Thiomicrospira sp.]|jgi:cbb3-type cytochrome oxidase maturation protein|nr:cbb3-type cytochrome oxidase assembly protein CcoS [Thiomicrospira sp.]
MEIIYITIPLVLVVGSLVVGVFIWMAKKGQFDDLDGAAHRILLDDEADSASKAAQKSLETEQANNRTDEKTPS